MFIRKSLLTVICLIIWSMVYWMVKVLLLGVVSFKFIFPGLMSQFINIILLLLKILEVNYGQILGYFGFLLVCFSHTRMQGWMGGFTWEKVEWGIFFDSENNINRCHWHLLITQRMSGTELNATHISWERYSLVTTQCVIERKETPGIWTLEIDSRASVPQNSTRLKGKLTSEPLPYK